MDAPRILSPHLRMMKNSRVAQATGCPCSKGTEGKLETENISRHYKCPFALRALVRRRRTSVTRAGGYKTKTLPDYK